jgi:hypothetical protein
MIANNFKALFWYVFLRFLTFYSNFFIGFNSSKPKSEQDIINRMSFQETKAWITFLVVVFLYYIFARLILKEQGSRVKNIISVSFIFVVALILCIVLSLGYHNFESFYFMYTSAFSPIFPTYIKEGGLLMQLPYTIIPCLFMGLSIRNTKSKESTR